MTHLKYQSSEAYHVVDVAPALTEIPRTADAVEAGAIGWSQVKAIASVANPETEARWIGFARTHRVEELRAEAMEKVRKALGLLGSLGRAPSGGGCSGRKSFRKFSVNPFGCLQASKRGKNH